jgi:hypothetical protein
MRASASPRTLPTIFDMFTQVDRSLEKSQAVWVSG